MNGSGGIEKVVVDPHFKELALIGSTLYVPPELENEIKVVMEVFYVEGDGRPLDKLLGQQA